MGNKTTLKFKSTKKSKEKITMIIEGFKKTYEENK